MTEIRWDPDAYLKYREERLRPGFEMMDRIGRLPPEGVLYDLGCGSGDHARALAERFPGREVIGVDRSPHMLETAQSGGGAVRFEAGDIADWAPAAPAALIFSNAALQWLGGHEHLMPRLFKSLAPGGVLAVQTPSNLKSRAHMIARDICLERGWDHAANAMFRVNNVLEPAAYWDILRGAGAGVVDIWETTYQHVLGADGVTGWLTGTALRPVISVLSGEDQADFLKEFDRRSRQAYPPRADGATLYPQSRLFFVARKP